MDILQWLYCEFSQNETTAFIQMKLNFIIYSVGASVEFLFESSEIGTVNGNSWSYKKRVKYYENNFIYYVLNYLQYIKALLLYVSYRVKATINTFS